MPSIPFYGVNTIAAIRTGHNFSTLDLVFQGYASEIGTTVYGLRPELAQAYADAINGVTERLVQLAEHPII